MNKSKVTVLRSAFLLIALVISLSIIFIFGNKNAKSIAEKPVAKDGVLDLRNWDFKKKGIAKLNGQWEFYYDKLLIPEDFQNENKPIKTGLLNIPGSFSSYIYNGQLLDNQGYATYRLKVLTNNVEDLYAIKTEYIQTSHKLWANGRVVAESGKVGKSKTEMVSKVAPAVGAFYDKTGEIEIVLQTCNYYYGVPQIDTILLGTEAQISEYRAKHMGFDLFLFGSTLVAGIYNFALFLRRKKDKATLYFSIVCFLVGLRTILVDERLIYSVFPNMNYIFDIKLLLWTFFLYVPMLVLFINSFYPNLLNKSVVKGSSIIGIVYFFVILMLPTIYYNGLIFPFEIISNFLLLYILYKLVYRYITEGQKCEMVIVAIFLLFITRLNDILYEYSIIQTGSYAPVGMLIFIFAQSYVLADRFSTTFSNIEEMTEKLKSIDKLKDDFLASTSHELKTPLNGIIGLSESLVSGIYDPSNNEQNETLELIQASAKRLSNLVNDILDFSKLKNNDVNLYMRAVDIRQLTNIVIKSCKPFLRNKKLNIVNSIGIDMPWAYGDENRIQQILYNLIGNAMKFTHYGEIKISAIEKDNYLEITISDTGMGIPKDQIYKIFEPYEQVEGINKNYGGTGLGLHITKKLIHLHGGQIKVQSILNKGSKFIFTLPKSDYLSRCKDESQVNLANQAEEPVGQIKEKEKNKFNNSKDNKRILIVDDEPVNIKVLKNFLEYEKYTVISADNGKEAINIVSNDKELDLVILDMMLPDMLGYEICSLLREKYSLLDLPILIMTADNRTESLVVSFECGANDYLRKPFERSELLARVKTLIELKQSVRKAINLQKEVANTTKQVEVLSENFEENKRKLSEILEYDKLKNEFFANISHELRTPLNVIWSSVQLLQSINIGNSQDGYDVNKYLKIMNQNSLRLLRLINNLIDTTKIDSGYLSLNLINGNIVYIVEEITLSAADYIKSQGIELIFDTDVEEKYMAFDVDKIERIVLNILSNAIKFTEKNGTIFVNIYDLGDKIQLSIRDTGIGIPEDKLDKIFERFVQVDKSLSRRSEGSGIGLALVKSLVEMQGGTIHAKSKLGEGSEFVVELPAKLVEEDGEVNAYSVYDSSNSKVERIQIEFSDIYE
ncbi:ATP-binding protein [Clostridium magnum]|uniref:Circadian input-output histidine kinase CikA n=1 Tax=Clostridium magnum DSM 2767 TaxID=1121326 RepID=A0A161WYQ3_9CLOT|nr:ATP-binding protein [Clostridium magnum]KZL92218.1 sensory/regulatory protein RpfC [Clostridium magnum DSM 2767]SHH17555.1 Signal transduction histidine kinase [Clostridium magnum DSM 2767]